MEIIEGLRPGIRQRGNSFQFRISLGSDGDGKPVRKYMTYNPPDGLTKRQLIKAVDSAFDDFRIRVGTNQSLKESMRFSDLGDLYFSQYAPNSLKRVTAYTYEGSYRKNILPVFGNVRLKDITTSRITDFLLELGKTKKPQTVRKNKIIFHSILKYAVSQKLIKTNPCEGTVWKRDVEVEATERDNYLNTEQATALMKLLEPYTQFNTIIKFLLLTGMRSGEVLGLTWDRIDFKNNTVFIDRTMTYVKGEYFLSTPKTKMSIRRIAITEETSAMLKEHKRAQDEMKKIAGSSWQHPELVFSSCTGHYYDRSLLNTQLRRFFEKHPELKRVTVHGLRHTHASLLIISEQNLDAISKHLGHASAEITSRTYTHTLAEVSVHLANTISDILK